ncbi:LLM class flavin-dependent oxidoreductase [Aquihabitans daechungensis]|uniref:LLM class flavin-dependent oxidoreductase n=1 Tax=Aquihabitans daechungensis TaxID=1052257 RepID=UPI003BA02D35
MHLGIHIVQPPSASPPAVLQASAHAAETLGYRSLWVGDRLIEGVEGRIGEGRPLDALATLAFLAAATDRIRLGTNVLAGAWYPPALLARSLATVDQLSRGRLTIGLGSTPSAAESAAAGIEDGRADDLVDGLLAALEACWSPRPAVHHSDRTHLDGRAPGPLPVQLPRPPILLAGRTGRELDRVGRAADGWHAAPGSADDLAEGWLRVRRAAEAAGRDPDDLTLVVRVGLGGGTGAAEVAHQVGSLGAIGASEVILEADEGVGLDAALGHFAAVAEAVELQATA